MARNPPPEPSMATTGTWNDETQDYLSNKVIKCHAHLHFDMSHIW